MVALPKWIVGTPRGQPDPAVVAEIDAIRSELDDLTVRATERSEALKLRVKALRPSHAREVLLASVLRLLQRFEAETEARGRALDPCTR